MRKQQLIEKSDQRHSKQNAMCASSSLRATDCNESFSINVDAISATNVLPQLQHVTGVLINQKWCNNMCACAVHIVPLTTVIHPPRSYTKRCCSMCRNASHGLHFCASPPGPRCAVHLPTPNCASTQPNCSSSCPIHPVLNA